MAVDVAQYTDRLKAPFQRYFNSIRRVLFGANNERLDFVMDSFLKLSPGQRMAVAGGIAGGVVVVVGLAVLFYFVQVNRLRTDLNNAFAALHELSSLKAEHDQANKNFERLVEKIEKQTRATSLNPFIEKTATDLGVTVEGLNDQKVPLPPENPLADKVQEVKVEMRLPNISVPRLMSFVVEVEKSGKYLKVQDLLIRGRYGTKMFFDAQVKVRGFDVNN